jgi:hypothetical protein
VSDEELAALGLFRDFYAREFFATPENSWRTLRMDPPFDECFFTTKSTKDTKDLEFDVRFFLLRALRVLRGVMSISILVATISRSAVW